MKPNYFRWWDMEINQNDVVARTLRKHVRSIFLTRSGKTQRLAVLCAFCRRASVIFIRTKIICKGSQYVYCNYSFGDFIYFSLFVFIVFLTAFTVDITFTMFTVLYYLAYGRSRPWFYMQLFARSTTLFKDKVNELTRHCSAISNLTFNVNKVIYAVQRYFWSLFRTCFNHINGVNGFVTLARVFCGCIDVPLHIYTFPQLDMFY